MEKGSKKTIVIVVIIIAVIALLIGGAFAVKTIMDKNETQKSEKSDDKVTKEEQKENITVEETPQASPSTTEDGITVGNVTLKYGKYKADFDVPGKDAYITINSDGTATYTGDRAQSNGNFAKVNLTGTWETEANAITMSIYDENRYSGIYFKWSNGEEEGFAIGPNMFGDQWHSFDFVK